MTDAISAIRTKNYYYQIKNSLLYRAIAVSATFAAVPLMIKYLGPEEFGVWSTILTLMSWVIFFDFGIGNGLRNLVAEALARDDFSAAKAYTSSAYLMVGGVALCLGCFTIFASYLMPWQSIFETQVISSENLRYAVQVTIIFVLANFWLGLVNSLVGAIQKSSISAFGQAATNVSILFLVFLISRTFPRSIVDLAIIYGFSMIISNTMISIWFFFKYPALIPSLSYTTSHGRPLLGLGLKFFLIQLSGLILFATDKIVIIQVLGPIYVAEYEVVYKIFSIITFVHSVISIPLWSAYTDAHKRGDSAWIRRMVARQLRIYTVIAAAAVTLLLLCNTIIEAWVGKEFLASPALLLSMLLYVLIASWNNIFAMIVNGIGSINIQLYTALIAMILNIPLSLFLSTHTTLQMSGIIIGTAICLAIPGLALTLQVRKLVLD